MRFHLQSTFYCLFSTLLLAQCKSNDPADDPAPADTLPAITEEGRNTFACRIDGKVWQPDKSSSGLFVYYGAQGLTIRGTQFQSQAVGRYLISLYSGKRLTKSGVYSLAGSWNQQGTAIIYGTSNDEFRATYQQPGRLTISRLDTVNHIIAGQFEAEVQNAGGTKHSITEGRFDIKY